jgi:transposase
MSQTKKSRAPRHWSPVHAAAAAIDIGATMHVAAVVPDCDEQPVRTFRTFTDDLERLADWFARCGIKTIAMESTGVYWIPVFEILEQRGFEVTVVNARDAKHVPGRKTDVSDAQWLQRLHEYGLLRASLGGHRVAENASRLRSRVPARRALSIHVGQPNRWRVAMRAFDAFLSVPGKVPGPWVPSVTLGYRIWIFWAFKGFGRPRYDGL